DKRGEDCVRAIYEEGARLFKEYSERRLSHEDFLEQTIDHIVQTYCLVIKGQVIQDIYFIPDQPVTYRPRFARDLRAKLPPSIVLPEEAFLIFTQERKADDSTSYSALFIQRNCWHMSH